MLNIVEEQVDAIRSQVGDGRAICALSGGVDSAVAAALVQRAIGDRLTCVYVDHGMMRAGETDKAVPETTQQRRLLWAVLLINASFFVLELIAAPRDG